jgi:nitroimidazol reductase NimA-like FMN-containing flavoprotein (pyridoxamine 5'-phosphate oxidase superfamily)
MAISTVRPDGWPQTTIVGYANDGLALYFLIFRSSQKFANIRHDNRVSIAVGGEPKDMREAKAMFAGAHAFEVVEPKERAHAWQLLVQRHPNLADFDLPGSADAALMRADCQHVSVLDYSKGFGHTEAFSVGEDSATHVEGPRREEWGSSVASDI